MKRIEESEESLGVIEYLEMQPKDVTENTFLNSGAKVKNLIKDF